MKNPAQAAGFGWGSKQGHNPEGVFQGFDTPSPAIYCWAEIGRGDFSSPRGYFLETYLQKFIFRR
jgi:hypothetical protein